MNTSVEQLRKTYIGVDRSEFEHSARELSKVLTVSEEEGIGSSGSRSHSEHENGSGSGSLFG